MSILYELDISERVSCTIRVDCKDFRVLPCAYVPYLLRKDNLHP